jgi:Copper resistance protein D
VVDFDTCAGSYGMGWRALNLINRFCSTSFESKGYKCDYYIRKGFERIGIPALLAQIITGLWMAGLYIPPGQWFSLASIHHQYLWIKIGLVVATIMLAIHARFFIIPKLSAQNLPTMALHIIIVTVFAVGLLLTGLSFRYIYF